MSEGRDEGHGISDDELPEDLKPGEDNPLASGLEDGETAGDLGPGDLLDEGKQPDQWEDEGDGTRDGSDGSDDPGRSGSAAG